MDDSESLSHNKWECKYHVVFIPKCRRKSLYGQLRPHTWASVQEAIRVQRKSDRGRMSDHVHMLTSIPAKYSASQIIGYIK